MKYDFTSILDRRGKDAIAIEGLGRGWSGAAPGMVPDLPDEGFDPIPMWVADMNFPTVPTIPEEIIERAKHPAYGYFLTSDKYYESIVRWHSTRNGVKGLTRECIGYENGVLGGVLSAMRVLCSAGDKVLLNSPTYIGFTEVLQNNGYDMVLSPMHTDEQGIWRMDFDDMERRIAEEHIHTAIFCSPHNPCGRVWEHRELERAMDIFRRHDVYVISDEIWSDLILNGYRHIPTQSVSEDARQRTVALYAPSKTFNLAGLIGSYHIIYNSWLRDRIDKESSLSAYDDQNVLSMHALIGAYRPEGYEWLDELRQVLTENVDYAFDHITENYPGVSLSKPQGTYMLFLDCSEWCREHGTAIDELLRAGWKVGVAWQDGRLFNGPCHIRMNLALPLSRVKEAFDRLDRYVFRI